MQVMKETTKNRARLLVRPVVSLLARAGVSPSAVTLAALPLSVAAAWAFSGGRFLFGGILAAVVGVCDSVDGELSRRTGRASPAGAFLDSNVDRVSEALVFTGLAWHYMPVSRPYAMLCVLALAFSLLVSYVRARAEGVGRECRVGFFERPVRVVVLLAGAFVPLPAAMPVALAVIAAGSLVTVVHRMVHVLRQRPGAR